MQRLPLLDRLGLHRPELRAWALYDWANSAFVLLIITALFPVYYGAVPAAGLDTGTATAAYGWATSLSLIIVAVLSPFAGALADLAAVRKILLGACVLVGICATALLAIPQHGDWLPALILFGVANVAVTLSFVFYDSLLPHIAEPDELDRVSAGGFALGYLGSGLLLLVALAAIQLPAAFGMADSGAATRASFVAVAVWWGIFSIPLFLRVQEPPRVSGAGDSLARNTLKGIAGTWRDLRTRHRDALQVLVAIILYNEGIGTIIRMAALFAAGVGLPQTDVILAILLVQFLGVPASFLFGNIAGRIGTRGAILSGLAVYAVITFLAFFMTTSLEFYLLAVLLALVQGGTQALSRSLFASMIPRVRSSEFFGFYSVFEKAAGIAGPALFGLIALWSGSSRNAILSVLVFFLAGGIVLARANIARGRAAASLPHR
jgi:UMF1 family MFS transporter